MEVRTGVVPCPGKRSTEAQLWTLYAGNNCGLGSRSDEAALLAGLTSCAELVAEAGLRHLRFPISLVVPLVRVSRPDR